MKHDAQAKSIKQGKRIVWDAPATKAALEEWEESLKRGIRERDKRAMGL
jgi:hypothetical protein